MCFHFQIILRKETRGMRVGKKCHIAIIHMISVLLMLNVYTLVFISKETIQFVFAFLSCQKEPTFNAQSLEIMLSFIFIFVLF